MSIKRKAKYVVSGLFAGLGFAMASAHAVPVTVTITNNSAENTLHLSPLFVAFHNGNYDAFDLGSSATTGTRSSDWASGWTPGRCRVGSRTGRGCPRSRGPSIP